MSNLNSLIAYDDDPVCDTVHHPYSAYNQGFDAWIEGHTPSLNPYTGINGRFWQQGWLDAQEFGGDDGPESPESPCAPVGDMDGNELLA